MKTTLGLGRLDFDLLPDEDKEKWASQMMFHKIYEMQNSPLYGLAKQYDIDKKGSGFGNLL